MVQIVEFKPQEKEKMRLAGWLRAMADKLEEDNEDTEIDVVTLGFITGEGQLYSFHSGNKYDTLSEIGMLRVICLHTELRTAGYED